MACLVLHRYQDHGDKLQVDNLKLNEELETQKLNLRDINEFLTNELKARSLTTSALEAKVYELNQLLEEVKRNHEVCAHARHAAMQATVPCHPQSSSTACCPAAAKRCLPHMGTYTTTIRTSPGAWVITASALVAVR